MSGFRTVSSSDVCQRRRRSPGAPWRRLVVALVAVVLPAAVGGRAFAHSAGPAQNGDPCDGGAPTCIWTDPSSAAPLYTNTGRDPSVVVPVAATDPTTHLPLTIANHAPVIVRCTASGPREVGPFQVPSDVWDQVDAGHGPVFIADAFVYTGTMQATAPTCGASSVWSVTVRDPRTLAGEPCTGDRSIVWRVPVSQWAVPPGCFAGLYRPDPSAVVYRANGSIIPYFGDCNWWPEALLHLDGMQFMTALPSHAAPRVGVVVAWPGHWGFVESIGPNGWILVSEMNFYWRGGGFGVVDYRYVSASFPGAEYKY